MPAPAAPVVVARLSASARTVVAGGPVVLTARALSDGTAAPGVVVLERRTGSAWTSVRTGRAGQGGVLSWTLLPDRSADHRLRVGDVVSAPVRVDVRQRVTAAASRTLVTGAVAPAGRAAVALERRTATGWAAVARATTDAAGRYRLAHRLPRGTVVRVVAGTRPGLLPATSAPLRTV